jgi:hypothetical protein
MLDRTLEDRAARSAQRIRGREEECRADSDGDEADQHAP